MPQRLGYQEEYFLKQMKIQPEDAELLMDNCTKVNFEVKKLFLYQINYKFLHRFILGILRQNHSTFKILTY